MQEPWIKTTIVERESGPTVDTEIVTPQGSLSIQHDGIHVVYVSGETRFIGRIFTWKEIFDLIKDKLEVISKEQ
jgi:hypothetical protein